MTEFDCPEVTLCGWRDVKVATTTDYIFTYEKSFKMFICLWQSLIVPR